MESFVELLNEWEIQLLVLLSFTLQMFLFFTGGLRRRSTNAKLRFSMWIAYLGADLVAVYALGYLSRHTDTTTGKKTLRAAHPLAFLWAPFLLIHLGGQDTITAFAIEDNNLWSRHLLNLVVQVVLALYVFWESLDLHNVQVLVAGIFVFIAGIIKYGERTLALMYGDLKSISSSIGYVKNYDFSKLDRGEYFGIVSSALNSAPGIRELFAGSTLRQMEPSHREVLTSSIDVNRLPKLLEIELDLMYDDIYTKAMVLRTWSGIMLRCVSQVSMVVAFVLFIVNNKHRYNRADLAITYVLFTGGFCLEVCAVFILLMSPWTWAWLEAQECGGLASISKFLLSSNIGRPEGRPLWSNSMGQYNFQSYVGYESEQSRLSKLANKVMRKMASLVGAGKGTSFLWMSKLLDTKYVEVDKEIMDSVVRIIYGYHPVESTLNPGNWPNLGPMLGQLLPDFGASFGYGIVCFHVFTEVHLSKYNDPLDRVLVSACRKLSNYMLYLLVTHPEMLPVSGTTEPTLRFFLDGFRGYIGYNDILHTAGAMLDSLGLMQPPTVHPDTLKEMRDLWTKILIYSAGKSRAEMHAAQLSRGGELLTFAWLLMAHKELGDVCEPFSFPEEEYPSSAPGIRGHGPQLAEATDLGMAISSVDLDIRG